MSAYTSITGMVTPRPSSYESLSGAVPHLWITRRESKFDVPPCPDNPIWALSGRGERPSLSKGPSDELGNHSKWVAGPPIIKSSGSPVTAALTIPSQGSNNVRSGAKRPHTESSYVLSEGDTPSRRFLPQRGRPYSCSFEPTPTRETTELVALVNALPRSLSGSSTDKMPSWSNAATSAP